MNKLIFNYEVEFGDNLYLVANNHKDLEEYLNNNYDFFMVEVQEEQVIITEFSGHKDYVPLVWAKHI